MVRLDLLLFKGGRRIGVECKRTSAPIQSDERFTKKIK
jgi:hypothetical protein